MIQHRKPRIGLVLGGGSARGWAHVGVIRALEEAGIRPDIVCGTSVGALVGAVYAAGRLDEFEAWLLKLRIRDAVWLMDPRLNGGMLKGKRLMEFFRRSFLDHGTGAVDGVIEDLPIPFGAVATSLHNGAEVWLRSGPTLEAVRASIAMPGLFTPVLHEGAVLVDGGLVNPVPVSLARAMGADIVIAVDLASDRIGRFMRASRAEPAEPEAAPALAPILSPETGYPMSPPESAPESAEPEEAASGQVSEWLKKMQGSVKSFREERRARRLPSMLDVVTTSLLIMQVRIARSRMAGEPPDALIAPRMAHVGLLDFHRAGEGIAAGRKAVALAMPTLHALEIAARG